MHAVVFHQRGNLSVYRMLNELSVPRVKMPVPFIILLLHWVSLLVIASATNNLILVCNDSSDSEVFKLTLLSFETSLIKHLHIKVTELHNAPF